MLIQTQRLGPALFGLSVLTLACLFATNLITATSPTQSPEEAHQPPLTSPVVQWSGKQSEFGGPSYMLATNEAEWIRIWNAHHGLPMTAQYDRFYDPLGLPLLDFDRYMIVGIFQPEKYNVAGLLIESIQETSNRIVLRFDDKAFQTASLGGSIDQADQAGGLRGPSLPPSVRPYGFCVLPRTKKPIVLEENTQRLIGKPPIWTERHQLKLEGPERK